MIDKSTPAAELLDAIAAASAGLLYPSETDVPLTPYRWSGPADPTPEALLAAEGKAAGAPVEARSFEAFFDPVTQGEGDDVERFRALADLLRRELADLRVYRVGAVDIDVIVLGKHPSGVWLGLRTKVVET